MFKAKNWTPFITLILCLCGQTALGIWWAAKTTTIQNRLLVDVRSVQATIDECLDDCYKIVDAEINFTMRDKRIENLETRLWNLNR